MKFCMLTTFFGTHSFGGDAAFVDRLSRALARHGHEVHVIHCRDAFEVSRGDQTPRPYEPPPGVVIHPLASPLGPLSPLATHQTGHPLLQAGAIRRLLRVDPARRDPLPQPLADRRTRPARPARARGDQAHDDARALARLPAARPLEVRRRRLRASGMRPLLRPGGSSAAVLAEDPADGAVAPAPRRPDLPQPLDDARARPPRGPARMTHLPYFLPHDYTGLPEAPTPEAAPRPTWPPPAGSRRSRDSRTSIDAMRHLPGLDLRIAGSGQYEPALRDRARGLDNVHFEGRLDAARVAALFRGARAVVVPSLVYETFGYVVLEAFAERTPGRRPRPRRPARAGRREPGGLVFDYPRTPRRVPAAARLRRRPAPDPGRERPSRPPGGLVRGRAPRPLLLPDRRAPPLPARAGRSRPHATEADRRGQAEARSTDPRQRPAPPRGGRPRGPSGRPSAMRPIQPTMSRWDSGPSSSGSLSSRCDRDGPRAGNLMAFGRVPTN